MACVLKILLYFLRRFRFLRGYTQRCSANWASFLAFISRKLGLWRLWHKKPCTFPKARPAEPSFPSIGARGYSVLDSSADFREYVVAASAVPASVSLPSLHDRAPRQTTTATPSSTLTPPVQTGLTADNAPSLYEGRHSANPSSANLSIQSRASDRLSILTQSRGSLRGSSPVGQASRHPRATYRQFGRGPDPSRSRERPLRTPSPINRSHPIYQHPHLEINTNIPPAVVIDPGTSSVLPPSASSYTYEHSSRKRRSLGSVAFNIENPSTASLASSSSPPPLTNEPLVIGTPSAPGSPASEIHEELTQPSPTASSVISDFYLPPGRVVQLIHSDQVPRYEKEITIPRGETSYKVKPLTTVFPYFEEQCGSEPGLPKQDYNPWMPATHPDGALYFFDPNRRLFTDTDMHNALMRDEIEEFYHYLQKIIRADQLTISSNNYDLVLDIMPEDEKIQWSYYYACHDNRCLFWLETYDASYMLSELNGVSSPAHIKHRLEASYWNHWSLFPAVFEGRSLPLRVYDELMGILSHGCVDVMTSTSSTLPYDDDTMHKMINLVRKAQEADGGVVYYTAATTRLLSFFAHWRFLYFHGQRHARLVRDKTVYNKPKRERTLLITLLSPLLFFTPEVHLRDVERLWMDDIIIESVWRSFMMKLLGEWEDVILWSTLVLTANVGFLAIPGVVLSNLSGTDIISASQVHIFTSPSQIASSLSIEASLGSIVIGLLLVRHNRTKHKEDPGGASAYLDQSTHRLFGLEPMAIIFSLPWALLMWSMVIFFIALLLFCFSISNMSTRIFVSVTSVMMAPLVVGCLLVARRSGDDGGLWRDSLVVLKRSRNGVLARLKHLALGTFQMTLCTSHSPPSG